MVNWREAEVNYLIDLVKSNSYVWNSSVPDFKKKHKKALFWELAADKINNALHPRTQFTRSSLNIQDFFVFEFAQLFYCVYHQMIVSRNGTIYVLISKQK